MPIEIGDKLPLLMVTLATALAVVPVVIFFVHCMIDGELGVVAGLCAIGVALLLLAVSILAPHPIIPAIVLITIIASIVMFPFARSELDKREHKVLDTAQLEKAHREFAQRPDNVYSRFAIAKHLYDHGLAGHAIAIAEEAGSSLSREVDPVRNASQRDLFDRELRALANWKVETRGRDLTRPVACVRCRHPNPPGAIACARCKGPFLLDLARAPTVKSALITKLVLTWTVVASVVVAAPLIAVSMKGMMMNMLIAALIAAAGGFLYLLYREKPLG